MPIRVARLLLVAGVLLAAWPGRAAEPSAACLGQEAVAVDVGHTPNRPGATSAQGRTEYGYNLALGKVVLDALREAGFPRSFAVDLTGMELSLLDRTRIARQGHATLFISLHHDSVQPRYLQTWTVNGTPQRFSDQFHGYSVFVSALNPDPRGSEALGRAVATALQERGQVPSLHHAADIEGERRPLIDPAIGLYRFDGLAVLRSASVPAVLIEAGIIVNREEELRINTPALRNTVAAAVVQAVRQRAAVRCGAGAR